MTLLPDRMFTSYAAGGEFTATPAPDGKNYVTLSWEGTAGSKFAITKNDGKNDIYETIPLKYNIKVLNVFPNIGNNLKGWMAYDDIGSPIKDGTKYTMTVDEANIINFNVNPSSYLGVPGAWKYDVVYFGGYDSNNKYDITVAARNALEQFIKSSGGVLLGHDTACCDNPNFLSLATNYLDLQATGASTTSPDYIPRIGNVYVKVARKGLLTNYPHKLGDVGTVMKVPESHSYQQFASGNIWFSYNGTNSNWDPSMPEMTTYKGKTGTNNFYLTTLNNIAMIQTGHSNGGATEDEQMILANTLYYLAQTTNQTTFDDHSAQDLNAPSKVSGNATVTGSTLSFNESVDVGSKYSYKLYTVDDVNGTKADTGKTTEATVKTGLQGYSYVINQNANAIGVDNTVEVTNASIDVSTLERGNYYLHIRAIDNAGNASEESVIAFTKIYSPPTGVITLNKPIYNNDKSGYGFKSATITNIKNVNSIVITTTNGATIEAVPSFLESSSKSETSDGDSTTYTYNFDNGITISQVEEFLRGIVFDYKEGTDITVYLQNDTSGETAVGTYNLVTDGDMEEGATITLNAPVYSSGNKSEFSFADAEVNNIGNINSLTIKLDNYTNVLSKPSTPATTNELTNIAGATNTIIYQFEGGIGKDEAQSFLRGLKFRYGGLKDSSTTNVSVTVDGNTTNLPEDANITEFNGHYYMYVDETLSWTDAYKKAKTYNYMGLKGYLATITSEKEDKALDSISMNGAWSAGTRYTGTYDKDIAPSGMLDSYFKWACGPEAGTNYYYFGSVYNKYPVNGSYNGFVDTAEPNGYTLGVQTECCMQVHYTGEYNNSPSTWNDLRDIIYAGSNNGYGNEPNVGYFVEFSDYSGGRIDSYTQSANGKSVVPIEVSMGDVFNSVKNGGTYYVDTVLKTFDRNITNITVNGYPYTSGSKLICNQDLTYTIQATDLEGNIATITITTKTIASVLESIKDLNVGNVKMGDKDNILSVKEKLMAIDTTDASVAQKTEIANGIKQCNDLYFALFDAASTSPNGTNGWYKNGIEEITLTAPDGFQISTSATGTWTNAISINKADGANKTVTYYLRETASGDISGAKTFSYSVDTVAPTGSIKIKTNQFITFLNTITFGTFLKDRVDVSITGTDVLSTPVSISYQKVKQGDTYNESGVWTPGTNFSVEANEKFTVYAKLVDAAGNLAIINSNGVVVYTDSTSQTTDIEFTKTATTDVTATVNLNGNTIKEIKNGTDILKNGTDYTVDNDTITFKSSYLDSLVVNNYVFTISYNPMGESYVENNDNQAPATTELRLVVKAKNMSETGGVAIANVTILPDSLVYTGNVINTTVVVKDGSKTLVKDIDYTQEWTTDMTSAGEKTLTITFKGSYNGVITRKVTIAEATIVDKTNKTQSTNYNGNQQTVAVPTGTTVNNQTLTIRYSTDGSTYNLTSAPRFISAGTYTVYYQLSAPNHNVVTDKITFTIHPATDNVISNLIMNGWIYGEAANTPKASAKYGIIEYTYSDREDGTYTTTVPTEVGTYFVKARVISNDSYNNCEAKTSFVITNKSIDTNNIVISGVDGFYIFTNRAITPDPVVMVNNTVLKKDIDYTVAYENNVQVGIGALVKVILKGNYSGSAEKNFEIGYGTINEEKIKNMITLPTFNSEGWYNKDIDITAVGDWTLCTTPVGIFGNKLTISDESKKTGTDYTFYIKAKDGSVYERTLNYKLDKGAPEGSIGIQKSGMRNFLRTVSFGLLFNSDVDVTVDSSDSLSGIKKVEVYKAEQELSEKELADVSWSEYTTSIHETAKDAKHFVYYTRITDIAGNKVIVNSNGVTFDTTAPVIKGISSNGIYYTTQKVYVVDPSLKSLTINNKQFASGVSIVGNVNATYTITATDEAGNTTTFTVTMKPIVDISGSLDTIKETDVNSSDLLNIQEIRRQALAVDTTNATQQEKDNLQKIIDRCDLLLKKIVDNQKPESSQKPVDNQKPNDKPKTGDTSNISLWIALLIVSGGVFCIFVIKNKRRKVNR